VINTSHPSFPPSLPPSLGTYNGHSGSITDMSVSWNSKRLVTASGDCQVKLWDVQTGEELLTYTHSGPVRGAQWAEGGERFATVCDPFGPHNAKVQVFNAPEDADPESLSTAPEVLIEIRPREERPTKVREGGRKGREGGIEQENTSADKYQPACFFIFSCRCTGPNSVRI